MTYLKDIKLCVDCVFFGTPQNERDRCLNPTVTGINKVDGSEMYPLAFSQRTSHSEKDCGDKGKYWIHSEESSVAREKARQEFEEAMRDCPF
jgi:hypothetical protein